MATTKLWHIQGRLKDLVDYVENPEKTVKPGLQDFFNVFSYTQNPDKTADGQFVTAINCQKDIGLTSGIWMILTDRPGIWPVTTSKPWRNCWQIEQQKNHSWKRGLLSVPNFKIKSAVLPRSRRFFSEKRKRRLLPESQPCARTSGTVRKSNSVPWKSRTRWTVLLKRSTPAGTERSMPICMKIDKVGNHWEKRGQ